MYVLRVQAGHCVQADHWVMIFKFLGRDEFTVDRCVRELVDHLVHLFSLGTDTICILSLVRDYVLQHVSPEYTYPAQEPGVVTLETIRLHLSSINRNGSIEYVFR